MEIFVNAIGVASAAGSDKKTLWNSLISGKQSGIKTVETRTGEKFLAAKIDDALFPEKTSAKYDMRIFKIEEMTLSQIENEIEEAKKKFGSEKIAVCVGSCDNGTELSVKGHEEFFKNGKFPADYDIELQGADYVATFVSKKYGLKGPSLAFSTACSSGAASIIKAAQLIKSGAADCVIAGGIDIASDTVLIGFNSLEAVSKKITNPFSKNRSGITLGEGAAFLVLSKENFLNEERPVKLLGYGESADAYHATSPDPSGKGAAKAMEAALKNANLTPEKIDYINLHGTGTKANDSMEAKAVSEVFGDYKVKASATKPMTGHTLGAAGSLEAAICCLALKENLGKSGEDVKLPVQVWDGEADKEFPTLDFVCSRTSETDCVTDVIETPTTPPKVAMSNSFAFGGSNACLILGI